MLAFGDQRIDPLDRTLDLEPLGERYLALLRAFAIDTARGSPFFRNRLQRAGVDPERIATFDDFRRIPILGPNEMAAASEIDLLPQRYAEGLRTDLRGFAPADRLSKKFSSSGSTGNPKVAYYTVADWDNVLDSHARLLAHVPIECQLRTLCFFHPGHFGGKFHEDSLNRKGFHCETAHFMNDEARSLDQLYRGVEVVGGFTGIATPPRTPAGTSAKGGAGLTLERLLELD